MRNKNIIVFLSETWSKTICQWNSLIKNFILIDNSNISGDVMSERKSGAIGNRG